MKLKLWRIEHSPIKLNFNVNGRGNNVILTINKKILKFVHKSPSPNAFYALFSQFLLFRHLRRVFQVNNAMIFFLKTKNKIVGREKKIEEGINNVVNRTFTDKAKF